MSKYFKDFTFMNKKLSSLSNKYIAVSFDEEDERYLAMERDMEMGERNRYKTQPNYFYDTWTDNLRFELNIVKDPDEYGTQNDLVFSHSEIRELSRWLTSPHLPNWIKFENLPGDDNDVVNYHGWFKNIEPFVVGSEIYGLTLYFECTSSFGFTDSITNKVDVSTYKSIVIENNSDELYNYCYPSISITPNANGQIYICNLSDCNILNTGTLNPTTTAFDELLNRLEEYGRLNGFKVEYANSDIDSAFNIVPLCNDTAIQFYYIDRYNNRMKCTAFYLSDSNKYYIIDNGFMYMTVYKDLPVYMDCQKLTLNDELGRMLTYEKLGISEVDSIYWPKLIHGDNSILFFGNCLFEITHTETRKVGD